MAILACYSNLSLSFSFFLIQFNSKLSASAKPSEKKISEFFVRCCYLPMILAYAQLAAVFFQIRLFVSLFWFNVRFFTIETAKHLVFIDDGWKYWVLERWTWWQEDENFLFFKRSVENKCKRLLYCWVAFFEGVRENRMRKFAAVKPLCNGLLT